jgi:tetratricopeptide (TPR) repeat protein
MTAANRAARQRPLAGYTAELRRLEQDIAVLGGAGALATPIDAQRVTQYVYCRYQTASIAGDLAQLSAVERVIERAVPLLTNPGDLYLLRASVAFKLHRLADVQSALAAVPSVYESSEGRLIRADLDFQQGRYQEAKPGYLEALQAERSWSAVARLAYFHGKMGDVAGADRLYREAEEELTAKEMRSYAWLEVQRGFLAFTLGRYGRARSHYDRADAAYTGYWLVDEYLAELLGAEGRHGEAIDILEGITATNDRPDLQQAIGKLCEISGQADRARYWQEKAAAGYLQSVRSGEVHYYHHLADYYADVAQDGTEAISWARADLQLRENFSTEAALAWAYYRNGEFGTARNWIDRALASGAAEAHLFLRASAIHSAAGNGGVGQKYLKRARHLNPAVDKFHIHH